MYPHPRNPYHQHLIRNAPNVAPVRWLVRLLNHAMTRSGSRYVLRIRYRKPRRGHRYGYGGNVRRMHARAFSVYIDTRPAALAADRRLRDEDEGRARRERQARDRQAQIIEKAAALVERLANQDEARRGTFAVRVGDLPHGKA